MLFQHYSLKVKFIYKSICLIRIYDASNYNSLKVTGSLEVNLNLTVVDVY